jgi:hypothetical protein
MENWVRRYAAMERQRSEILKPVLKALLRQIESDVAIFREEYKERGKGVSVETAAGRIQRELGNNSRVTILIDITSTDIVWKYMGTDMGGKPGRFSPKDASDSVLHVSEVILKPILFPGLYAEEQTQSKG